MVSKKRVELTAFFAFTLGGTLFLAGCESEGPTEQAGQQIDKGIQNAKDAINPPGPVEKAGRAVDKAINK